MSLPVSVSQAPEIASGADTFSGTKADIWAAGISLYQMVCGKVPFEARSLLELYDVICEAKVDVPEHVSPSLRAFLHEVLQRSEAKRLSIPQINKHRQAAMPPAARAPQDSAWLCVCGACGSYTPVWSGMRIPDAHPIPLLPCAYAHSMHSVWRDDSV